MSITLKAARVNAGLTQVEAAKALDITKGTLANYETGKTEPSLQMARRIAELYNMNMDDIIFFAK